MTKDGVGTLTLLATNTFSGATTISGGILIAVAGGSCSNSAVTVGGAGVLGVTVTNSALQWTCGSLALDNGAQVRFTFGVTPSTNLAPLNVRGNLTFGGTTTFMVDPARVVPGTHPLLVVGGMAPTAVPALSGVSGSLSWGGAGNRTLSVTVAAGGSVLMVR